MINTDEPLQPAPQSSAWGRKASRIFLLIGLSAVGLTIYEVFSGRSGVGSLAAGILSAPWSVLLAPLARAMQGRVPDDALRVIGLLLALGCVLLNSRIVYGIAARMERDLRAMAAERRTPPPPSDPA
ncbi:MAG: hypothetical protein ABIU54_04540 [Candidatus Eisenbacteria bacterium]